MSVYAVYYGEGEPYAPVVISLCATMERAEKELNVLASEYDRERLYIEEMEVLE